MVQLKFIDDYPVPEPGEKEALIRVSMAGICNTDIEITRGYLGFHGVMGHEFVGIVEQAPENAAGLINRRVVGEINCGCGTCDYCKTGIAEALSVEDNPRHSGERWCFRRVYHSSGLQFTRCTGHCFR